MYKDQFIYFIRSKSKILDLPEYEQKEVLKKIKDDPVDHTLDAIMYLSGNSSDLIRISAFSTLSALSKFSSECKSVLIQIKRDIAMPKGLTSKHHSNFIKKRLMEQKEKFVEKFTNKDIAIKQNGLYSLLRLSQEPSDEEIEEAAN